MAGLLIRGMNNLHHSCASLYNADGQQVKFRHNGHEKELAVTGTAQHIGVFIFNE